MTKERIRASIPKSIVRVVPDEDLSNLESDIRVRERSGPEAMDSPSIIMEPRKHRRHGATDDDHIRLATLDSRVAHVELGTRDL